MNGATTVPNEEPGASRQSQYGFDLRTCLILAFLSLLIYNANLRLINASDTYPARYMPFGILRYGSMLLDPIAGFAAQGQSRPFWIVKGRNGHALSLYPVVIPVITVPLYLPAVAYLDMQGWTVQRLDSVSRLMEKLVSSLIASVSVILMYMLLRRRADARTAILLTIGYAFGTNTWMISSQAMWQHGVGEMLLVACLFLLTGPCTAKRALAAGGACGIITWNRPPDAILVAALGLYGLWWAARRAPLVVVGATVSSAPFLTYNLFAAGNIFGGYGLKGSSDFFHYSMLSGVAGLLFSPTRGLLIFSPFLLFLPLGMRYEFSARNTRHLALLISIAVAVQMLMYAKADWREGCSWGPRWLTDMLPLLVWMLAPFVAGTRRVGRAAFILATCASIAVQAVGAFWYTGKSDEVIMAIGNGPDQMKAAWDFRNTPFIFELRHPPAPRNLMLKVDGFIDSIKAGGREVTEAAAGEEIVIQGWALTDNHTPAMAEITLIPGKEMKLVRRNYYPVGETVNFEKRADVNEAMHTKEPSGWRAVLRTEGIVPGEYILEAFARDSGNGELHPVAQRQFKVLSGQSIEYQVNNPNEIRANAVSLKDEALGGIAQRVAIRIGAHQNLSGYWLTSYTQSTRFDDPKQEMNTFLTSMLVDILDPVAMDDGLHGNLERARHHLSDQIESNGLVRYHGRPDSPTIPALGCAITPDTDDTALAWRIAGSGKEALLPGVLEILKSYRTGEGLYRTWLAPRDQYLGIDPGKDPNPTDIGIQMNLLMFLKESDPPAARELCKVIQGVVAEDRVWVYYQKAPLVPLLQEAGLRRGGYPVKLPQERLQTSVRGQMAWVTACRLLAAYETGGDQMPSARETLALLKTLANDDFSAIRHNPPLIYHNDLSAKAKRFYWSEDFGYALWLRLHKETRDSNSHGGASPAALYFPAKYEQHGKPPARITKSTT